MIERALAFRRKNDMPPADKIVAEVELYAIGRGRSRVYWPAVCLRPHQAAWRIEPSRGLHHLFWYESGEKRSASAFSFVAAVEYALRIESEATGARWADPETWSGW